MSNVENFETPYKLDVSLYGMEKISETLSKSRVRIFYKGMNRNSTFISDEFADQLIASLPYTPVKGIFDKDSLDYEDHGEDNTDGRIYGIVPENPNFQWEDYLDTDGITRTYACCDVYLFTGLYPEANLIPGKSQSMEIYRKTLQGEWRLDEQTGKPYYYFLKGGLVGLQALGDDVEPCFEGSAFFALIKDLENTTNYLKNFTKKEEKKEMDKTMFRLSDHEKADILFDLINTEFNEEGGWKITGMILEVYDDYALCVNNEGYFRTYYTKDGDNVSIGDSEKVKITDVTESEYTALEAMKSIGSYTEINEKYNESIEKIESLEKEKTEFENTIESLKETNSNFEKNATEANEKIENLEKEITDFNEKINSLEAEKVELNNKIYDITNENTALSEFKANVEKSQKEDILTKYEEYLSDDVIKNYREKMSDFSVSDFKKEICTAAVENTPTIFEKNESPKYFKGNVDDYKAVSGGAIALLNKRKNGGNK